jgi:microcompartment protein CcmL/EutN
MKETALGIIETFGFIPAVEACDTAVKSAAVELLGFRYSGAGLVSVLLTGDISSVKASVDAGKRSAERLGRVISFTVIGRTAQGLETVLFDGHNCPENPVSEPLDSETAEMPCSVVGSSPDSESAPTVLPLESPGGKKESLSRDKSALEAMSVKRLRNLARTLEPFSIARKKIKFARKDELVNAISVFYGQQED